MDLDELLEQVDSKASLLAGWPRDFRLAIMSFEYPGARFRHLLGTASPGTGKMPLPHQVNRPTVSPRRDIKERLR